MPIVVGLLASAIGTIFWCCCRPCRCCGQRIPKPEGYTVAERWLPVLCLFLFALCAGYVSVVPGLDVESQLDCERRLTFAV